jgi:predicted benzoate:H+ symporter BenE
LFSTSRQVAVALGVAIAATALITRLPSASASAGLAGVDPTLGIEAFHDAVAIMLVTSVLAVFFAYQVRDPRPVAVQQTSVGPGAVRPRAVAD